MEDTNETIELKKEEVAEEKSQEQILKEQLAEIDAKKQQQAIAVLNEALAKVAELGCEVIPNISFTGQKFNTFELIIAVKK